MSCRSEYPSLTRSAKSFQTTKGKRKAPSRSDDHDNPTPVPSSQPGMAVPSARVRRQLPNLAPKSVGTNPGSAPIVECEALQSHKRPRVDHDIQTSHLPLGAFARLGTNLPSEQPMYLTNDTWSHSDILDIDTSLGGSNALPTTSAVQGSGFQLQNSVTLFDLFSGLQNASQEATACSFGPPSTIHSPAITTTSGNFQMPIAQASVGCCPRCHAMLRNLRESIIAITCRQELPSGGGGDGRALEELFWIGRPLE